MSAQVTEGALPIGTGVTCSGTRKAAAGAPEDIRTRADPPGRSRGPSRRAPGAPPGPRGAADRETPRPGHRRQRPVQGVARRSTRIEPDHAYVCGVFDAPQLGPGRERGRYPHGTAPEPHPVERHRRGTGLLIRWPQVRILPGAPQNTSSKGPTRTSQEVLAAFRADVCSWCAPQYKVSTGGAPTSRALCPPMAVRGHPCAHGCTTAGGGRGPVPSYPPPNTPALPKDHQGWSAAHTLHSRYPALSSATSTPAALSDR